VVIIAKRQMELEAEGLNGAGYREKSQDRLAPRNSYRDRTKSQVTCFCEEINGKVKAFLDPPSPMNSKVGTRGQHNLLSH
jgi:hypothetical protein